MGHLILATVLVTFALSPGAEKAGVPANIHGGPFQSTLAMMWKTSPTFRAQCARIALEETMTVRLRAEGTPRVGSPRARTEFSRRNGTLIVADIVISDARDRIELI